ncbi:MAG: AAA family ATPase [Actinomycetota bacterium]|nr:AAA family ATPase [Actinomycetota bacterium]
MGSSLGTIICIFGTKGGAGRTTIAANLAVSLGQQGHETVLVDFDLQAGAADQVLGLTVEKTIDDLIRAEDFTHARDYLTPFDQNLEVLISPQRPEPTLSLGSSGASEILSALREFFDFVVVDLPGTFANHVSGALEAADFIGLVMGNDILSTKNAVFALQNMALLGYDLQTVRLIVNAFDRRGLSEEEVEAAVGLPIFWRIDRDKSLLESLNQSKPVVLDKPKSPAGLSIKRLALALAIEYGKTRGRK